MVCMRRVRCSCDARATRRARNPNPCVSRRAQTRTGDPVPPADGADQSSVVLTKLSYRDTDHTDHRPLPSCETTCQIVRLLPLF